MMPRAKDFAEMNDYNVNILWDNGIVSAADLVDSRRTAAELAERKNIPLTPDLAIPSTTKTLIYYAGERSNRHDRELRRSGYRPYDSRHGFPQPGD